MLFLTYVITLGLCVYHRPLVAFLFLFLLALLYFDEKSWQKKLLKLSFERKGCDIGDFVHSFPWREIDTWIIRAVYEQVQRYVSTDKITFPIFANDHLYDDLKIDEEELADTIMEEVAQRTGRTFENIEKNPYLEKLNTVRDVVYFFQNQPLAIVQKD